jgi:hypothetical protein
LIDELGLIAKVLGIVYPVYRVFARVYRVYKVFVWCLQGLHGGFTGRGLQGKRLILLGKSECLLGFTEFTCKPHPL